MIGIRIFLQAEGCYFWYNRWKKMRLEKMILIRTHLNVEEFAGREAEEIALAAEMV